MVRDELKMRRDKAKVAAVKEKEKARKAAPAKPEKMPAEKTPPAKASTKAAAKPAPAEVAKPNGADHEAPPAKRRGRKPAVAPTTA